MVAAICLFIHFYSCICIMHLFLYYVCDDFACIGWYRKVMRWFCLQCQIYVLMKLIMFFSVSNHTEIFRILWNENTRFRNVENESKSFVSYEMKWWFYGVNKCLNQFCSLFLCVKHHFVSYETKLFQFRNIEPKVS
jgi:hypothetical protein